MAEIASYEIPQSHTNFTALRSKTPTHTQHRYSTLKVKQNVMYQVYPL